ncbi:MAG: hypothetical protein K9M82_12870 [Deltaproteobacteria bacterium]|nr:hypothetical protein [Deltaproteobacteria bacterium]
MRLDFRFSERPLENLWCEAVVAFVFQRRFLTQGTLSGLDAKMGGLLGRLEKAGFWTADPGENLLVASEGRIKAEKMLLCGMGDGSDWGEAFFAEQVESVGRVLVGLQVSDFAVHIPMREGEEADYPARLEMSVQKLAAPYVRACADSIGRELKVVFSIERFFSDGLLPVADRLRSRFGSEFDLSVVIEREKHLAVGA